jgi:hypothetical protein
MDQEIVKKIHKYFCEHGSATCEQIAEATGIAELLVAEVLSSDLDFKVYSKTDKQGGLVFNTSPYSR